MTSHSFALMTTLTLLLKLNPAYAVGNGGCNTVGGWSPACDLKTSHTVLFQAHKEQLNQLNKISGLSQIRIKSLHSMYPGQQLSVQVRQPEDSLDNILAALNQLQNECSVQFSMSCFMTGAELSLLVDGAETKDLKSKKIHLPFLSIEDSEKLPSELQSFTETKKAEILVHKLQRKNFLKNRIVTINKKTNAVVKDEIIERCFLTSSKKLQFKTSDNISDKLKIAIETLFTENNSDKTEFLPIEQCRDL